mmetsp:Transcript_22643/g.69143  ORF Transcript_22643/g.69143 Transcript_22643/m.69143 type:complete len:347 (-) Transcript_22643:160-1200(-)
MLGSGCCRILFIMRRTQPKLLLQNVIETVFVLKDALAKGLLRLFAREQWKSPSKHFWSHPAHERWRNKPVWNRDACLHVDGHIGLTIISWRDDPSAAIKLHPLPPFLRRQYVPAAVDLGVFLRWRAREAHDGSIGANKRDGDCNRVHPREGSPRFDANVVDNIVGLELVDDRDRLEPRETRPPGEGDQIWLANQRTNLYHRKGERRHVLSGTCDKRTLPVDGELIVTSILVARCHNVGICSCRAHGLDQLGCFLELRPLQACGLCRECPMREAHVGARGRKAVAEQRCIAVAYRVGGGFRLKRLLIVRLGLDRSARPVCLFLVWQPRFALLDIDVDGGAEELMQAM